MSLPPGPRWPAFIQTIALLRSGQTWIERQSRRHGDLFTIRTLVFGTQVFTSDPELIKQLFTGDPDVLRAGEANSTAKMITGDSVLVVDGEPHRRARKLLMPPFHGERMVAYAEAMRSITERVVSEWREGTSFALLPSLQRITLEVIVANVFGLHGDRRANLVDRLSALMERLASPLGAFFLIQPLQRDLGPLYPWRRLKAQFDDFEALVYEEIALRRADLAKPGAAKGEDILSMLIEARDDEGKGMPDKEIRDQLLTLVIAGHETTASSLAWAFERILAHPEVLNRLLAELDAAAARGKTSAADTASLEYLDATIKEVMRQRPSVPMLGRKLSRPVRFRDYEIPKGAMVSASVYLVHRRPELYPDPEAFKPERFLGQKKTDPYAYIPFGGGPRRCLGAAFATQEMKVVVATILQTLRLRLAKPPPLEPSTRSIFLAPKGGTEVFLEGKRERPKGLAG